MNSMRGKWKGHKDLEQFTQGQITENKGELIKSLIQLKGFQRAFGDRWNGRLEAQTSQEGPTHQCPIHSLSFPLQYRSVLATAGTELTVSHRIHCASECPWCPSLENLHINAPDIPLKIKQTKHPE